MFFMVADVRMVSGAVDEPNAGWNGEVPIFDMAGFSLRHLTRVVLSVLRVYMKYTQEAHPVRLRQIHIINCVSYVDRVLSLVKPFMKNEVLKLVSCENLMRLGGFSDSPIFDRFTSIHPARRPFTNSCRRICCRTSMAERRETSRRSRGKCCRIWTNTGETQSNG